MQSFMSVKFTRSFDLALTTSSCPGFASQVLPWDLRLVGFALFGKATYQPRVLGCAAHFALSRLDTYRNQIIDIAQQRETEACSECKEKRAQNLRGFGFVLPTPAAQDSPHMKRSFSPPPSSVPPWCSRFTNQSSLRKNKTKKKKTDKEVK